MSKRAAGQAPARTTAATPAAAIDSGAIPDPIPELIGGEESGAAERSRPVQALQVSHGPGPGVLRRRVTYLMLFRLVLISLVLGATILLSWLSDVDLSTPNSLVLFGIIATTYLLTILYSLALRRQVDAERLADYQLVGDLITSAVLVHVTGGAQSAYTFFFPLSIIAAATVRFRAGAVVVAVASMALFSLVSVLGWLDVLPSFAGQRLLPSALSSVELSRAMALNLAAFAGVAVLAYNLGGQIQQTSASLETQRTRAADLRTVHEDIVRSLSSGLITMDRQGQVLTMNKTASDILGRGAGDAIGAPVGELLPGLNALIENVPERNVLHRAELAISRPHSGPDGTRDGAQPGDGPSDGPGRRLILGITVSPLRNNRDQVLGRILHFQDLTELHQMEQQMRQAERLAVVGTLAAGVAHEIRNPLAAISGSIELLRADPQTDADSRALMNIVNREIERLNTLITDLLDYTNPQPRELITFDVVALVAETLAVFEQDRSYGGVTVSLAADSATSSLDMLADPGRVRQVLWNLLRNGAEAAESRVTVRIERQGGDALIDIEDDGPGVAEEHLDRVFDPFFTTKGEGTGLGLATCQSIVTEQGGAIYVDNLPDRGCRFRVRLPLQGRERSEPQPAP